MFFFFFFVSELVQVIFFFCRYIYIGITERTGAAPYFTTTRLNPTEIRRFDISWTLTVHCSSRISPALPSSLFISNFHFLSSSISSSGLRPSRLYPTSKCRRFYVSMMISHEHTIYWRTVYYIPICVYKIKSSNPWNRINIFYVYITRLFAMQ